jgi:hypothetical protein
MDENESVYEVHTPTRSELATFQVLANTEFVNLQRMPDAVEEDIPESVSVRVYEEEFDNTANFDVSPPQPHVVPQEAEEKEEVEYEKEEFPEKEDFEEEAQKPTQWGGRASGSPRLPSPPAIPQAPSPKSSFRPSTQKPSRYKDATKAEIEAEKEGLLSELHNLERQGLTKLVRPLTMDDSLEEIQFQYDRIQAELNANQMVDFAKSSIKMGSGMAEMLMKKAGIKVVDGYHNNLCKDMNKFNRPLNRLYKKYWRRGGMSPEAELGMLVLGSLAWTVVQNKMGSATAAFTGTPSDVPPPPSAPANDKPPASASARPMMRPPQMSSLNVPTSWSSPVVPPAPSAQQAAHVQKDDGAEKRTQEMLRQAEEKLRSIELARADIDAKFAMMQGVSAALEQQTANLERRAGELDARESALKILSSMRDEEKEEFSPASEAAADEKPRRVVVTHNSATPKKSARKVKNVAIDI